MFLRLGTMLKRFFEAKSFIFHNPKPMQVPKLTYLGYFCISCMYTHHVCMLCMNSMHVFYACILSMYSMHAFSLSRPPWNNLSFRRNYVFISICFVFVLDWRCVFYLMVLLMLCCFVVCFVFCFCFRSLVLLQVATFDCSWYGWGSKIIWCVVACVLAYLFVFLFVNYVLNVSVPICLICFGLECLTVWLIDRLIDRSSDWSIN